MKILVTGAAGFIGSALSLSLLKGGCTVIGVDNLSDYYSVALKRKRLARLEGFSSFSFHKVDLCEPDALTYIPGINDVDRVVHLAAQAGVRYSIQNPYPYVMSNIVGHLTVLEYCRRAPKTPFLIYASSSSVYGNNLPVPYSEDAVIGDPASLYAVTKQTDEAMSRAYAALYGVRQLGVRLFTVYGPWGRPDMAYWMFTRCALKDLPVMLYNGGEMARDFTYIEDVVAGLSAMIDKPASALRNQEHHRIFNLGSGQASPLMHLVEMIADATGRALTLEPLPMQAGDLQSTCADIQDIKDVYGYAPKTDLSEGVARFVEWFRSDPDLVDYSAKAISRDKN